MRCLTLMLFAAVALAQKPPQIQLTGYGNGDGEVFAFGQQALYDQISGGQSLLFAQEMDPVCDAFSAEPGDDFPVSAFAWSIDQVQVMGEYNETGDPGQQVHVDATGVNVFFYEDAGGQPGAVIASYLNVPAVDLSNPNFAVPLDPPAVLIDTSGMGTTYWMGFQAVQAFCLDPLVLDCASCPIPDLNLTQWQIKRAAQVSFMTHFRNPGGGFGVCMDWTPVTSCGVSPPTDLRFALFGTTAADQWPSQGLDFDQNADDRFDIIDFVLLL